MSFAPRPYPLRGPPNFSISAKSPTHAAPTPTPGFKGHPKEASTQLKRTRNPPADPPVDPPNKRSCNSPRESSSPTTGVDEPGKTKANTTAEIFILSEMLVPHDSTPRTLNDNPSFGEQAKQLVTEQTLQSQFRSGSHSNKLFFANRDGGSMLQRLESLERLEKLFEDSQATIKQQAAEFDARQQALENRVEHQAAEFDARQQTLESKVEHHAALLRTVEPYALDVRNRWMSENSMNLKKEYPEDEGIKKRVSAAVHSAEAYLDSLLYHKPDHTDGDTAEIKCMRSDSDTYTEIYGIKWKDVYFLGQYFCGLSAINRRGTLNYLKHSGVKTDKRRYDKMQEEVLDFNTKYDKFLTKTKKYLELKRGLEGDDDRDGFERLQMDKRKEVEDTLEKVKQLALACVQKEKLPC